MTRQQAPRPGGLDGPIRDQMEQSFGRDLSHVRVHHDGEAARIGARAFTVGADIHFAPGEYAPDTSAGRELIGHELTHVIQQDHGRVGPTLQAKGRAVNADTALELEADELGARAARGERVAVPGTQGSGAAPVVQGMFTLDAKASLKLLGQPHDGLKVSDDGSLAAMTGEQWFLASAPRMAEANEVLARVGSKFTLGSLGTQPLVSLDNVPTTVHKVEARQAAEPAQKADNREACNEMAQDVVGAKQMGVAPTLGIERQEISAMGLDVGAYLSAYTAAPTDQTETAQRAVDDRHDGLRSGAKQRKTVNGWFKSLRLAKGAAFSTVQAKLTDLCKASGGVLELVNSVGVDELHVRTTDKAKAEQILEPLDRDLKSTKWQSFTFDGGVDDSVQTRLDAQAEKGFNSIKPPALAKAEKELRLDAYAEPSIGSAYGVFPVSAKKTAGFPYHWAGVVAKAGADTVTFESYAGRGENKSYFNLYGPLTRSHEDGGKIVADPTLDKDRTSTSFHEFWQRQFKDATVVTVALGEPQAATPNTHPGLPKDTKEPGELAAAVEQMKRVLAYWRRKVEDTGDPVDAKTAIDELLKAPVVLNAMLDDAPSLTTFQQLKTASTQPAQPRSKSIASWGLEPKAPPARARRHDPRKDKDEDEGEDDETKRNPIDEVRPSDPDFKTLRAEIMKFYDSHGDPAAQKQIAIEMLDLCKRRQDVVVCLQRFGQVSDNLRWQLFYNDFIDAAEGKPVANIPRAEPAAVDTGSEEDR